ncbi:PF11013 family protein [Segatella baroniae F0067]|uniref:PF11013 family protein n=1 Tax=Segatella baroniae F0067 TaxID=1115809 RepID=U2NJA0_9BACT|nr:DUF2851 family protein [Segatella baroniae]ERK38195.1 PF11013 family protein [Segatella baroniae F0067]
MEQLLHYVWKHKLWRPGPMATTDGRRLEIIDPGLHNRDAGPDFFNAKIKVGGTLWVGNVEIHDRSSDWYLHGHDRDSRYNNVILHVCGAIDRPVRNERGEPLTQLQLDVPEYVKAHYDELLTTDRYPPCHRIIPSLSRLGVHAWMNALQTERLEQKTEAIADRLKRCDGSWEAAYFVTLARNYGFGINGDAFEAWACHIPLQAVAHHQDNLLQVEAFFLGQAGLLDPLSIPERHRVEALADSYFLRLRKEYLYLQHKFSFEPIDFQLWKFLRLRPQNFPHIRIAQLANLFYQRRAGLSQLLDCHDVKAAGELLRSAVTPYWETHYTFGHAGEKQQKRLSAASLQLLLINTVVPILFAYGRHKSDEKLCQRAFDFLDQLKAENNHIVRMWQDCGLNVENAGDSQALIQLKKMYCDRKDCLRCRIGYAYLRPVTAQQAPTPALPKGGCTG